MALCCGVAGCEKGAKIQHVIEVPINQMLAEKRSKHPPASQAEPPEVSKVSAA
jgi:hypothetical protein